MNELTDTLEIKIAKAREKLPQKSRNAIDAVSWKLIILEINKDFNEEQIETLTTETELLLCRLVKTDDFPKELETRMKISRKDVSLLLAEMDKLIFKKMQEELEKRLTQKDIVEITYKSKPLTNDPNLVNTPKDVQTAVSLSNWKEKLYVISKKYGLSVEKMGELEDITVKTLKGDILASKYENEVKNRIVVPEGKEKEMVAEINEEIFRVIKGTLVNSSNTIPVENKEIPIPPYAKKKENIVPVPLPPPSYKKEEIKVRKDEEKVDIIKNEDDLYKEHGIEIISDVPTSKDGDISKPKNNETIYREEIPNNIVKPEETVTPTIIPIKENDEYKEEIPNILGKNIIKDKLFGNTISKTVVNDYSLPKISKIGQNNTEIEATKAVNPHDPYHEAI